MHLIHFRDRERYFHAYRGMMDFVRLHDSSWYWQDGYRPPEAILDFGLNDPRLQYVPYWRNDLVTSRDAELRIACWTLPDRLLVVAFNANNHETKDAALEFHREGLHWPAGGALTIRELRGVEQMDRYYKRTELEPAPRSTPRGRP